MTTNTGTTTGAPSGLAPIDDGGERRRTIIRRFLISLVVLGCLGGLVVAANHTVTGEPEVEMSGTAIVEQRIPARGSEVLRQAQLGIDLALGYTGVLVVNGTEIPESQLLYRPELNQIFFSPGEGQVVDQLRAGENCVQPIVWKVESNRASGQYLDEWCFQAT